MPTSENRIYRVWTDRRFDCQSAFVFYMIWSLSLTAGHAATIEAAYKEGLTDNASPCELSDFYDCDYIFLCTPVQKNMEYLRLLKGHVCDRCIITDVGSVKTDIHREVTALGMEAQFIGGHPMAGSRRPVLPMPGNFYWKMLTIFLP